MKLPKVEEFYTRSGHRRAPLAGAGGWTRLRRHFSFAFACLLTAPALLAIYIDPHPRTIIIATLFGCAIMWSALRRRPATKAGPGWYEATRELRASELRADLRRSLAWVCLFPVGLFLASLLKFSALSTAGLEVVFPRIVQHARAGGPTLGGLLIMLVVMLFFAHRAFLAWRELRRLRAVAAAERISIA